MKQSVSSMVDLFSELMTGRKSFSQPERVCAAQTDLEHEASDDEFDEACLDLV